MYSAGNTVAVNIGDNEVFREIFSEYYPALCLFAHRYTDDTDSAADIVQDAFVSLWSLRENFNTMLQVKSFLYTCVRNKALNEIAHLRVVSSHSEKIRHTESDATFHDYVIETETFRLMRAEIDRLPAQMGTIMRLSLDGLKNAEIADRLHISINTVRTLKRLAYKKLRKNLDGNLFLFLLIFIKTV